MKDDVTEPKKVEGLSNITKIDCGSDFTMVLDDKGKLFAFGNDVYGQLGIASSNVSIKEPTKLSIPMSQGPVVDFSCGEEHAAYIDSKGNCHTWGYGQDGQLGHANKESLNTPKKLQFAHKVSQVKCGGGHTGLITESGALYLMGRGRDG